VQENIIVKVTADIADFSRKIKKISDAGTVFQDLDGRWRNAQGQFVKMSDQSKKLGGALSSAASKAKSFASSVTSIASGIGVYAAVSKGIGMISNSLDGAISRYDTLNNFPRVLQQIGFSADDSEKAISKLSDGIQGLPTTLDDVASTAQRIAVMTGDLDGAVDTTLALNNAFISSGSDAANAARGLEQYVQMLSRGEVGLEEWRTLQETMGVALNDVAKAFGFAGQSAQNDLYDALKSGEITMEEFNAKLIELNDGTDGFAERALTASGGIKTAWTNMQTSVVRGVTNIIEAIDSVLADTPLESIENIINNIGDAFFNFLDGIAQKIPTVVGLIGELVGAFQEGGLASVYQKIGEIVSDFGDIIVENLPKIIETGREMYLSLVNGIMQAGPELLPVVSDIIITFVEIIVEALPEILKTGQEVLQALIKGIADAAPAIVDTAIELIKKLVDILIENLPQIIDTGVKMLVSLIKGINDAQPDLQKAGIKLILDLARTLIDRLPDIIKAGFKILMALIDGIIDALPDLLKTGVKLIKDLASELLAKAPGMLKDVGEAVVEGIWEGIKSLGDWLKDKVSGFFGGIVDWGKKALGINSPSRVIRDQVGRWIPAGLVDGINSEKNAVIKAAEQLAQWATPDVPDVAIAYSTPSGLRSSLSSAVSGTVDVNMNSTHGLLSQILAELKEQRNIAVNMDGERVGQLVRPHVNEGNAVDALVRRYFD
jgi:tape measure domain-containing protein